MSTAPDFWLDFAITQSVPARSGPVLVVPVRPAPDPATAFGERGLVADDHLDRQFVLTKLDQACASDVT